MKSHEFITEYIDKPYEFIRWDVMGDILYVFKTSSRKTITLQVSPVLPNADGKIKNNVFQIHWGIEKPGEAMEYTPPNHQSAEDRRINSSEIGRVLATLKDCMADYFTQIDRPMFLTFSPSTQKLGKVYDRVIQRFTKSDPLLRELGYTKIDFQKLEQQILLHNRLSTAAKNRVTVNLKNFDRFNPGSEYFMRGN